MTVAFCLLLGVIPVADTPRSAPLRMSLADALALLRAAGYGEPVNAAAVVG